MCSVSKRTENTNNDLFIQLVDQRLEEIEGVLLFADVDSFAPKTEHAPEPFRFVILQLALQKMTHHLLNLKQHAAKITVFYKSKAN